MYIDHISNIMNKPVAAKGNKTNIIEWLLADKSGVKSYSMRNICIDPGQNYSPDEFRNFYEMYITSGCGTVMTQSGEMRLVVGSVVYAHPDEISEIRNTGCDSFELICYCDS